MLKVMEFIKFTKHQPKLVMQSKMCFLSQEKNFSNCRRKKLKMKLKMEQKIKKIIISLREQNLIKMEGRKRRKEVVDAAEISLKVKYICLFREILNLRTLKRH